METENRQRYYYEKTIFYIAIYSIGYKCELIYSGVSATIASSGRAALSFRLGLDFKLVNARAVSNQLSDGSETVVMFWNDELYIATNKKAPEV